MSDIKERTNKAIQETAALENLKRETGAKKIVLESRKINNAMERLEQNDQDMKIAQSTSFGQLNVDHISLIQKENSDYINAAKSAMNFINPTFNGVVPYFRKNLILIGGKTGEGKSTAVANIVYSTISQKNPLTEKPRRALVLTNEERSEDVYNRITCLINGWHYTNHDKFTDSQVETFNKFIGVLSSRLTVVDNAYNGAHGMTTSIEGIKTIFDNLIRDKEYYDVIIIDYYQNVKYSKNDITLSEYDVQAKLANLLDMYKNLYPAPIVLMTQVKPTEDIDDPTPMEYRIKGRKVITDPSTLIMEMVADRENLRTKWIIWKSRFTEAVGRDFYTGYNKGKFVLYGDEHIRYAQDLKSKREQTRLMSGVFDKKDDEKKKEE